MDMEDSVLQQRPLLVAYTSSIRLDAVGLADIAYFLLFHYISTVVLSIIHPKNRGHTLFAF